MTTILYDSTDPAAIPLSAAAVAGYANGRYAWKAADYARFVGASRFTIDVLNAGVGHALDIERGDASIPDAPRWVSGRQAAGVAVPWLYISLDSWAALHETMLQEHPAAPADPAAGLPWAYWVAHWTGAAHELSLPDGTRAAAVQYADPAKGSGGAYDVSAVFAPLPGGPVGAFSSTGATTTTSAPSAPSPGGNEVNVPTIRQGSTGGAVKSAQAILNAKGGAGLATDGHFGPRTEAAVQNFQRELRLGVDGIVGPQTWGALVDV